MLAEARQDQRFHLHPIGFVLILLLAASTGISGARAESEDAAHALAEKFSAAADRAEKEKAEHAEKQRRQRAKERDALTKKIEEIERWVEEERAKIQAAEAEIKARKERAEKEAQAVANREAYEQELLERARSEAEERERQETAARAAEEQRKREAVQRAEEERRKQEREALAARRDEEAKTLAEKLEKAREKHAARKTPDIAPTATASETEPLDGSVRVGVRDTGNRTNDALGENTTQIGIVSRPSRVDVRDRITAPSGLGAPTEEHLNNRVAERFQWPPVADPGREKRVTILIEMDIGKKGIRRWSKTADPMLCTGRSCFLSQGPAKRARKLNRSKAFGPSVALGVRGLACRSSPRCIFRDVDLGGYSADLQPIDLRFLRHDRRATMPVQADGTCQVIDDRLSCRKLVKTRDWRAWIVPESVAKNAGSERLSAALKRGLKSSEIAVQRR